MTNTKDNDKNIKYKNEMVNNIYKNILISINIMQ